MRMRRIPVTRPMKVSAEAVVASPASSSSTGTSCSVSRMIGTEYLLQGHAVHSCYQTAVQKHKNTWGFCS